MKARMTLLAALAFAFVGTGCQPPAQEAAGLSDADVAALEAIMDEWARSALAGDMDAWASLWAEDGVKMNPNAPAIVGREAIRESTAALAFSEFTIRVDDVAGQGDLAYVRGTFSAAITAEGMPQPMTLDGKYLTIFRKQADGTWLVTIDCWNSSLPLPEPSANVGT